MPGFGSLLGAELLAATNGDLTTFDTIDRLAGIAGLAPVPRDSGRISGTSNDPADTTVDCSASSTWPPATASKQVLNHETITTASDLRANATPRRSCASHGGLTLEPTWQALGVW